MALLNKLKTHSHYDAIVIGAGPAGAVISRRLAEAGKKTLLIERGPENARFQIEWLGEGNKTLVSGRGLGGSTAYYYATAWAPPLKQLATALAGAGARTEPAFELSAKSVEAELGQALERLRFELPFYTHTESELPRQARHLMRAARSLGYDWEPLEKLFHKKGGDRWTSREYIEETLRMHPTTLDVITGLSVDRVSISGGRTDGVVVSPSTHRSALLGMASQMKIRAGLVVSCAGGTGSPALLQRSGLGAGQGFFCDPLVAVFGSSPDFTHNKDRPMLAGVNLADEGIMLTDMHLPFDRYALMSAIGLNLHRIALWQRTWTVMVKVRDDIAGAIGQGGGLRRKLTSGDKNKLDAGAAIAARILRAAGAGSVWSSPVTAAHPGGSARIGETVDGNLSTAVDGLFVCDASVIPFPFGLPPAMTVMTLAGRLGARLTGGNKFKVESNTKGQKQETTHA